MQLDIFENKTPIVTAIISPNKEMPFEIFKRFYHLSYFMELMERLPDGRVIWDADVTSICDENMAEVHYSALQNDWFASDLEVPVKVLEDLEKQLIEE